MSTTPSPSSCQVVGKSKFHFDSLLSSLQIFLQTGSYSHFLFSKRPPRRVPGTTWHGLSMKSVKETSTAWVFAPKNVLNDAESIPATYVPVAGDVSNHRCPTHIKLLWIGQRSSYDHGQLVRCPKASLSGSRTLSKTPERLHWTPQNCFGIWRSFSSCELSAG